MRVILRASQNTSRENDGGIIGSVNNTWLYFMAIYLR